MDDEDDRGDDEDDVLKDDFDPAELIPEAQVFLCFRFCASVIFLWKWFAHKKPKKRVKTEQAGSCKAGPGKWGSCIRIVDPRAEATVFKLNLDVDEAAVCLAVCYFFQLKDDRPCLVVGTAKGMHLHPRGAQECYIKTFLYVFVCNVCIIANTAD